MKPHASAAVRVSEEHWFESGVATSPASLADNAASAAKCRFGLALIEPFSVTLKRGAKTSTASA